MLDKQKSAYLGENVVSENEYRSAIVDGLAAEDRQVHARGTVSERRTCAAGRGRSQAGSGCGSCSVS